MDKNCKISISNDPPAWEKYLQRNPAATVFHDPRWGRVMEVAYGNRPWYLTAERAGRVVGTLQLVAQRSLLLGSHICSLPYFDAAGILSDDKQTANALVSEVWGLIRPLGVQWAELRQIAPLGGSLPSRTDKVTLALPLPTNPDVLWKQLKAKVRNQIRKARTAGLTIHHGREELLSEFHKVYARNMRDLGSPTHSKRFFRLIVQNLGAAAGLFVVRLADRAIAASLTLSDRHGLHVPWAGSDWRVRDLCANMLLYWAMLAEACEKGAPAFDFGRSTRHSGTYRFKKQWGAQETPLYWHYLLAEGTQLPELRPDSPKYRFLVACWRRLPLGVARLLGPRIISKLS